MKNKKLEVLKSVGDWDVFEDRFGTHYSLVHSQWTVTCWVCLPPGHTFTCKGYGELDPVVDQVYEDVSDWMSVLHPDAYRELVERYDAYES